MSQRFVRLRDVYVPASVAAGDLLTVDDPIGFEGVAPTLTTTPLADLNLATDAELAGLLASPITLRERGGILAGGTVAAVRLWDPNSGNATSGASAGRTAFYFDPAFYAMAGYTMQLRLAVTHLQNGTAPAANLTNGLYPVTGSSGASGNVNITVGTVVTGSEALLTAPAASTMYHVESGWFTAPAAGHYALGVLASAVTAAGSDFAERVALQFRRVPA